MCLSMTSLQTKTETEYLNDAIARIEHTQKFTQLAEAVLRGAGESEPLLAEAFQTPQDIRYHAEGPFLYSHMHLILSVLYAIVEGDLHLMDVEEFRRMKGYEAEILDLEQTIKEHVGLFEAFAMCHDVTKWACATFSAPANSRGAELGFNAPLTYEFDVDAKTRSELRASYQELFHEFSEMHRSETAREIQRRFYRAYQIQIHYTYHDRSIFTSVYSALLDRFTAAHGLSEVEHDMLEDLIGHHMLFGADFLSVKPNKVKRYIHLATKRKFDAELFLKLIQGCLFFDQVCGSFIATEKGFTHDTTPLIHCLQSEHQHAPLRRQEKETLLNTTKIRSRNKAFQAVGLDGVALLDLLEMDPGPAFGALLREIHEAIVGEHPMPKLPAKQKKEIERRAGLYYSETFKEPV